MKILVVEPLPGGGIFQWALQLSDALARQGHDVTLLTGASPEALPRNERCRVLDTLPTWQPTDRQATSGLRRRLQRVTRAALYAEAWRRALVATRRERADVIHISDQRFILDCAFVWLLRRLNRRIVIIHTVHNPLPYRQQGSTTAERRDALTLRAFGSSYGSCDVLFALSQGPQQVLRETWPELEPAVVISHGDYGSLIATAEVATASPPSSSDPVALFFGNWTRYKNVPLLIDAFELVRAERPDARLVLAGRIPSDMDLAEIQARCAAIGAIDLRTGYVALEDLPDLFAAARFVVLPYETVNVSGVVHLAYSFGRPVVATAVGAMNDSVIDGVTGLVAATEASSLAAAMLRLFHSPTDADRLGEGARAHLAEQPTWDDAAASMIAAIEQRGATRSGTPVGAQR